MRCRREHEPWAEWKVMHRWVEYLNSLVKQIYLCNELESFQMRVRCTLGKYPLRQGWERCTQELSSVLWKLPLEWSFCQQLLWGAPCHVPVSMQVFHREVLWWAVFQQVLKPPAGNSACSCCTFPGFVLQVCEGVRWCILRNQTESLLNYSLSASVHLHTQKWALAHAALCTGKKQEGNVHPSP